MTIGEIPAPEPREGEVLVEPRFVGICGTDLHVYLGEFEQRVRYPAVLGHEFSGTVAESKAGFRRGESVAVDPILFCGRCLACRRGELNTCVSVRVFGLDTPGALCSLVSVPADKLYRLPPGLSLRNAVMLELYAIAVRCMKRLEVQPGETVVLLGAGRLGLSVLDVLRLFTPCKIIAVDINPSRLEKAQAIGADETIDPRLADPVAEVLRLTDGLGADRVIEAIGHYHLVPGQKNPVWQAMEMIRAGGRIVVMGQGDQIDEFSWKKFCLKEGSILASRLNRGDYPAAITLATTGRLHPDIIITGEVPFDSVPAVFEALTQDQSKEVKVVVRM